jgi:hypothetical protein
LHHDIEMLAVGDVADRQKRGSTGPTPESESDDDEFDVDDGERGLLQGHEAGTPRKDYASGSRLADLWHQVKSIVVEVSEQFHFLALNACTADGNMNSVGMCGGTRRERLCVETWRVSFEFLSLMRVSLFLPHDRGENDGPSWGGHVEVASNNVGGLAVYYLYASLIIE